jgi:hypothetical protein
MSDVVTRHVTKCGFFTARRVWYRLAVWFLKSEDLGFVGRGNRPFRGHLANQASGLRTGHCPSVFFHVKLDK